MKNYTQFDNALLESLYKSNLTSSEIRIYLMIIRYTTGYHRTDAPLSISFISKETGLHHTTVVSSLKRLQKKGYIVRSNRTSKGTMTSIGSSVETSSVETSSVETSSVETTKGSSVEATPTSSVDATHIKKKENIKEIDISKENGSYVGAASMDAPTTDPIEKKERLTGYDRRMARITQKIPR